MKLLILAAFMLALSPVRAQTPQEDGTQFASAIEAVVVSDWDTAAARVSDPIALEIIDWYRLRAGDGSFAEYELFLTENADWPGLAKIARKGEATLTDSLSNQRVLSYFSTHAPQTGLGMQRYAAALPPAERRAVIALAWQEMELSASERAGFLADYPRIIAESHVLRLDNLLWAGKRAAAREMLPLVGVSHRALANARLALQEDRNGVDTLIAAIPRALQNDAGLAYDRFVWRAKKGYSESAIELLLARSTSEASLGRPEKWASRRRTYARRAMRAGDADLAYRIASPHFLPSGSNYADLEWLSGYLSLRKLGNAPRSVQHFQRFRAAIASPISMGRAGYWLGEAHLAAGDENAAYQAYQMGARYQTSFYGQLAASRIGASPDALLAGPEFPPDWTKAPFLAEDAVRAGVLFYFAGEPARAKMFLTHAASRLDVRGRAAMAQLLLDLDEPHIALRIAKGAATNGDVIAAPYYPLHGLAEFAEAVPPALAMSIARQESEMNASARSPVGALGLMQVMPATAKTVARGLDLSFSERRLGADWQYNARIGTAYLAQMLERFDGSVLLAAAAYNAGPSRAERWIRDYGDPRLESVDAVDWIESIPFRETRNYVMRVLEAQFVYRARISGQVGPLTLAAELQQNRAVVSGAQNDIPSRPPRRR
ncbi:MAG: transglycosylase SLT domain-containing protein [Rhodobacteraceae bacterium]|nr:transglycosylase SLT domain-containing protein [Paracoccaceae bacterium]